MKKEVAINKVNPIFFNGICHRGLHNDKCTENGLKAFQNAIDHHMAFEYDVHITKDDELIVFHDSELKRVTGKEGIIEDLTLKEIRDNYRLPDGGDIPTLKEVFNLNHEQVPCVVELKVYKSNHHRLVKKVKEFFKENVKDKSNFILISFDPRAILLFKFFGILTELLICINSSWVYALRFVANSIDVEYGLLENKKYQKYSNKHLVNSWTIEDKDVLEKAKEHSDLITFQNIDTSFVQDKLSFIK